MNRLYVVESTPSLDRRHRRSPPARCAPSEIEAFARALGGAPRRRRGGAARPARRRGVGRRAVAKDLQAHPGALAWSMRRRVRSRRPCTRSPTRSTQRLGNVGQTVVYGAPAEARPVDQMASLRELAADMEAGAVEPAAGPGREPRLHRARRPRLRAAMDKVALRVHLGLYEDETAALPLARPAGARARVLERRARLRRHGHDPPAADRAALRRREVGPRGAGRASRPAGAQRPRHRARATGGRGRLRRRLRAGAGARALHDGVVAGRRRAARRRCRGGHRPRGAARPPRAAPAAAAAGRSRSSSAPTPPSTTAATPTTAGCRSCRKPLTKLTWDNAALMSPATAQPLGIALGASSRGTYTDVVELRYRGRTVQAPVWILPGQADDTVTVHLGYGRTRAGRWARAPASTPTRSAPATRRGSGAGLEVAKTGERGCWPAPRTTGAWRTRRRPCARAPSTEYRAAPGLRAASTRPSPPRAT